MFRALRQERTDRSDGRADIRDGAGAPELALRPHEQVPAEKQREPSVVLAFPSPFAKIPTPTMVPAEPRGKLAVYRDAVEAWCARVDLAPDLAADIGRRT
ncbi:hypothetical protein PMI02_04222, partial [Novosphingobium sp. AP12]